MTTTVERPGRRFRPLGRNPLGLLFSAPYLIFVLAIFAFPVLYSVWISFHDFFFAAPGAKVSRPWVGFDNYVTALSDPAVIRSFGNVGIFLIINVPLTVVLALLLATGLNRITHARTFLRVSYYIPYVTASIAVVAVWSFLFNGAGIVNHLLGPLAPDPSWLINKYWAMPIIALFVTWKQLGFYIPALPGVAAERAQRALRVGLDRRSGRHPEFLLGDGARGAHGDATGAAGLDRHRREPLHRAVSAHQRRRPGRRLRLARADHVPEGHRAGDSRMSPPRSASYWSSACSSSPSCRTDSWEGRTDDLLL